MSTSRISLKFLIILVALGGCGRLEDGGDEAPTSKVASGPIGAAAPPEQAPASAFPTTVMPEVVDAPARGPAAGDERRYHALEATGQPVEVQEAARDFVETTQITVEEKAEEKPKLEAKKKPKSLELLAGRNQPAADIAGDFGSDFDDDLRRAEVDKKQDQGEGEEAPEKLRLELNAGELDFETDDGKRDASKDEEGRMGGRATGRFGEQAATRDVLANGEVGIDGLEDFGTRRSDVGLLDDGWIADAPARPAAFLPSMFYFENTYLGRSAQFIERLRRLDAAWPGEGPYRLATLPPQGVDPPDDKGLSLSVALDRTSIDQPGKVYLQVTLQGSSRFGWRRPPLDVAVVIDAGAAGRRPEQVVGALQRLLATLGPQDRLGVVLAGEPPVVLAEVGDLRETRRALGRLGGRSVGGPLSLRAAMHTAGERLQAASQGQARVPGAQTVLVIVDGEAGAEGAVGAAHELTVQGATTSVIELGGAWAWWPVANAGHGNLHRVEDGNVAAAVDAELARISQVIARLLRVNIRLAPKVHAVRVLGSRVLEADEVRRVKAREEATDRQLSATLGVKADRGDDDDGIQTVIPFFYGGDAHVIAVELWVEGPGPVAEISLKYKDMVALENATAQAGARIGGVAKPTTQAELAVRRNVRGFLVAEALDEAGRLVARGAHQDAVDLLTRTQAGAGSDAALLAGFRQALQQPQVGFDVLSEALGFAGQRRISHVALRSTH